MRDQNAGRNWRVTPFDHPQGLATDLVGRDWRLRGHGLVCWIVFSERFENSKQDSLEAPFSLSDWKDYTIVARVYTYTASYSTCILSNLSP